MSTINVTPAKEKVGNAEPFTGVIRKIDFVSLKATEDRPASEYFVLDITGLPELYNEVNGQKRKAQLRRTRKQIIRDLDGFASESDDNETIYQKLQMYARRRTVDMDVSAYEAGAIATVSEWNKAAIGEGKNVGDEIETQSAGYYVEGFMDIDFAREDRFMLIEALKSAKASLKNDDLFD